MGGGAACGCVLPLEQRPGCAPPRVSALLSCAQSRRGDMGGAPREPLCCRDTEGGSGVVPALSSVTASSTACLGVLGVAVLLGVAEQAVLLLRSVGHVRLAYDVSLDRSAVVSLSSLDSCYRLAFDGRSA